MRTRIGGLWGEEMRSFPELTVSPGMCNHLHLRQVILPQIQFSATKDQGKIGLRLRKALLEVQCSVQNFCFLRDTQFKVIFHAASSEIFSFAIYPEIFFSFCLLWQPLHVKSWKFATQFNAYTLKQKILPHFLSPTPSQSWCYRNQLVININKRGKSR